MTRETAIEVIKDLWRYEHSEFSEKDIREALDMAIEALSAEVAQGEWIMKHDGIIFKRTWGVCSRCGNTLDFDKLNAGRGDANYCPNCGAKMKGGKKNV